MEETTFSADSVEQYLLAASFSPELQEFVLRSAEVTVAEGATVPVVFGSLTDPALLREVEMAAENATSISRRHGSTSTLSIYRFERSLVEAIRLAYSDRTGSAAMTGCEDARKLERRRKALRAMFLFDYAGSLDSGRDLHGAPIPPFTVTVDEDTDIATLTFDGQRPVAFPLSPRTVRLMERVAKLEQAASTHFIFRGA